MGPGKVLIFLIIIFTPVGLVVGALIMFAGIPLFYRLRRTPVGQRRIRFMAKLGLTVLFTLAFVSLMCIINIYDIKKDVDDYWKSRGGWSYWRMPLGEPYELCMVDTMEQGYIGTWKQDGSILDNIVAFEQHDTLLAGATRTVVSGEQDEDVGWFLFDCGNGNLQVFTTLAEAQTVWYRSGFVMPAKMKTVREHWYYYWKIVEEKK